MNHLTKKTTISDLREWSKNGETRKYGNAEREFTSAVHRGTCEREWEIGKKKTIGGRGAGGNIHYIILLSPLWTPDSIMEHPISILSIQLPLRGPELVPES